MTIGGGRNMDWRRCSDVEWSAQNFGRPGSMQPCTTHLSPPTAALSDENAAAVASDGGDELRRVLIELAQKRQTRKFFLQRQTSFVRRARVVRMSVRISMKDSVGMC